MEPKSSTIDPEEVEQFSRIAEEWWDPRGKFKPLHDINPLRVGWILEQVDGGSWMVDRGSKQGLPSSTLHQPPTTIHQPLHGKAVLDVGCGGGLICEPMAKLGASVTGIDASARNIEVAKLHAQQAGLAIDYRCMTAEELSAECTVLSAEKNHSQLSTQHSALYDIVLALEIIEHVADVDLFVESCCKLVKPGGLIIMSTLNRTLKSYAMAIVGAEYVLRILPRGTHDWNKFLRPSELCRALQKHGIDITEMTGMVLNPLSWQWSLSERDLDVNYLVCGRKL